MNNLLKWNPEFTRNVWTELTPQRLIIMPVLVGLIALLVVSMAGYDTARDMLHTAAMGGIILVGFLWGIKNSADAMLDEYNEKTWDWQKMSVIGPWKLAWGKLFGSTIYNWYGASICFVLYVITSFGANDPLKEIHTGILTLIGMISVHGLMILISLLMIRKSDGRSKIKSNRIFISGIIAMSMLSNIFSASLLYSSAFNVSWYGIVHGTLAVTTITTLFYCCWVIAGLYRSMRAELQFTDAPVWWIGFILSTFLLHYGFFVGVSQLSIAAGFAAATAVCFFQFTTMLYLLALSEPKDIVNMRLLVNTWSAGDKKTFFRNLPLWITTLPFVFLYGLLAVVFLNVAISDSFIKEAFVKLNIHGSGITFAMFIAVCAFIIRDLGVLVLLNLSNQSKRADSAWLIYLLVLYVILPMLFASTGLPVTAAFYPDFTSNVFVIVLLPLIEVAVILFLLLNKWKSIRVE